MTNHDGHSLAPTFITPLLVAPEVETITRLSAQKLYRLLKDGLFPPPIKTAARGKRLWRVADVQDWINNPEKWASKEGESATLTTTTVEA